MAYKGKNPTVYTNHRLVNYLAKHSIEKKEVRERLKLSHQQLVKYLSHPETLRVDQVIELCFCFGLKFSEVVSICAGVKKGTTNWFDE